MCHAPDKNNDARALAVCTGCNCLDLSKPIICKNRNAISNNLISLSQSVLLQIFSFLHVSRNAKLAPNAGFNPALGAGFNPSYFDIEFDTTFLEILRSAESECQLSFTYLAKRQVSKREGEQLAIEFNIPYIEVSAKKKWSQTVDQLFVEAVTFWLEENGIQLHF